MNRLFFTVHMFFFAIFLCGLPSGNAGDSSGMISGRTLLWSDEFTVDGPPNSDFWNFEPGFFQEEEEFYTDRHENVRQENGCLILEGIRERFRNPYGDPNDLKTRPWAEYTSGRLHTQGKKLFLYGRLEMRAKIPVAVGTWPAFWLLGAEEKKLIWPACGEIDILEAVGKEPDKVFSTVHYAGRDGKLKSSGKELCGTTPDDGFHIYALEWTPDKMDFFYDDILFFTFPVAEATLEDGSNIFRTPFYLRVNLAIGGAWGGPVVDSGKMPWRFEIDYIRYYAPVSDVLK